MQGLLQDSCQCGKYRHLLRFLDNPLVVNATASNRSEQKSRAGQDANQGGFPFVSRLSRIKTQRFYPENHPWNIFLQPSSQHFCCLDSRTGAATVKTRDASSSTAPVRNPLTICGQKTSDPGAVPTSKRLAPGLLKKGVLFIIIHHYLSILFASYIYIYLLTTYIYMIIFLFQNVSNIVILVFEILDLHILKTHAYTFTHV